ncbi:hypothetical protein V8C42DRAFT_347136 [Trichoderma barbatum]
MPNFGESSIPKHGWSKPTIIHLPTAYQQYVARHQSQEDPFVACARNEIPPPVGSPYDSQDSQPYAMEHPSCSKWSMGRNLTHPKPPPKTDRDEARSEWETVVGDDEGDSQMANAPKAKATLKTLGLVPETDDDKDDGNSTDGDARDAKGKGKKPSFSRPGTPFDAFGFSKSPEVPEPRTLRMDMEASTHPSVVYCGHTGFVRQPVHGGAGPSRLRGGLGVFPINSKTSSDESTDRFKYDGEAYSTFLQPSSTRETKTFKRRPAGVFEDEGYTTRTKKVNDEVRIPVDRGQKTRYRPSAQCSSEPAVEEDDECWPRVCNDAGTEADWQTVTTGPVYKMPSQSDLNLIKDTGSSLADVSDITEQDSSPIEHRRAPGTISHQRNRSIRRPEGFYAEGSTWTTPRINNDHGVSNAGHRNHKVCGEAVRPAARRPSNPFQTPPNWKSSARVIELDDSSDEDQPRDSKKAVQTQAVAPPLTRTDSTETVWPQVPRREETVNEFDQAFCETQVGDTTLPSDDSANVFSRLPFDLIDLKEAAKCYGSQRYRNADEANNFAERARLGPLWSGSSTEAGPSSSGAYRLGGSDNPPVERPSTAVFRDQVAPCRPTVEFDFVDNTPTPSSAILGSLRSRANLRPDAAPASESRFGHFRAAAALGAKCLRIKAPPPETENDQPWAARNETGGVLTPSEADLIESARGEIMDRRRFPEQSERKRRILFICIMAFSIVFPLIGLLALVGRFDSTVCWYALGEMQGFTKEQRAMLLQQLLVEIFVYTIVIVFMSLHFSGKL